MLLTMYKVGFGDCFKFEETISKSIINNTSSFECQNSISYKMLVDCGSKNAELSGFGKFDKFVDFVYNDIFISPDTEQVKRYALLTHFHEDHYKGFLKLSDKLKNDEDKFDKFYVPYITWSNKKALIFVKAAVYLYCFGLKQEESSFFLFKQIQMLRNSVKNLSDICCLKTDDTFKFGNVKFKVLWPEFPKGTHAKKIENLLAKIDDVINNKNELSMLTDKFLNNLSRFYELINNNDKKKSNDTEQIIDEILKSQQDFLRLLNTQRNTFTEKSNDFFSMIEKLKTLFKEGVNATSIVFCDNNCKLLMMGDVTSDVIDTHLFKKNWEYIKSEDVVFNYLKAPHHGTGTHYTINIPATKKILVSTGKFGSYGKISDDYYEHRLSEGSKICTSGNDWCNVIKKGKRCKNGSMCEISDNHKDNVIKIDL